MDENDDTGGCEHGEHPNTDPAGNRRVCKPNHRFCSEACADCDGADFDTDTHCCAGLCGFPSLLSEQDGGDESANDADVRRG